MPEQDVVQQESVEETPQQEDVKPDEPSASSSDATPDADALKSQIDALMKELARVRKDKNESSSEVQELREALSHMRGQLEALQRGAAPKEETNPLGKYTEDQLVQGQTEWEDELLEAKMAYRRAQEANDEAMMAKANKAIGVAKSTLAAIRKELLDRAKAVGAKKVTELTETDRIVNEVAAIYESAYSALPELRDKSSEIWKAGNDAYNKHANLMKHLGPLGELVAVAIAIGNNPELVGTRKQATQVRKQLLDEIADKAEKSLIKGSGPAKTKSTSNFEAMPRHEFDAYINKLKLGEI
jgi:predicted  nucleic acid-binding Zn-ribbon protein